MAPAPNVNPVASDGGRSGATEWNRGKGNQFEWVASSPSPADIAALERRFPEVIEVPARPLEEATADWRLKAVIARSLSRWVPTEAIVREFRRAGIAGEIVPVSLAHRHYFFRFSDPSAKEIALSRPWMANGQIIAVEEWRPQFVPSDDPLASALLWVRLPSLPLEYWSEEIIASILSVAGAFQYIDAATRERKRGGFARACVRVDLRNPLRPGARVGGSALPFWQQFVYEHLEGICAACGSMHPEGRCLSSPGLESSDSFSYGPWMAALRRRRSPQPPEAASATKVTQSGPAAADGWQVPKKVARRLRKPVSMGKDTHGSVLQPRAGSSEGKTMESQEREEAGSSEMRRGPLTKSSLHSPNATVAESAVPVSAEEITETGSEFSLKQITVNPINPFVSLGCSKLADRPGAHKEVNPGPLKRARPIEYLAPRTVSKSVQGKGKIRGKIVDNTSLIPSVTESKLIEPVTFQGTGPTVIRAMEVQDPEDPTEAPQLRQEEDRSHDTVVSLLRKAIQSKAKAGVMDSMDQCPSEGVNPDSCLSDEDMSGVVVAPPTK